MKIEEVQSTTKKQRIATHTHIKGLGLEVSTFSTPFLNVLAPQQRAKKKEKKEKNIFFPNCDQIF